ncbi:DUF11 domain-containing protein [Spirosoma taeanense]|uniref:DUF11 domain-containing protein n=2 Tax=Spirosoma taeanense TaxID=2735870 RepID=A0A6M5YG28_9BACT|nr:DUF11 domain-containing protein [Spirosoma taeanense]
MIVQRDNNNQATVQIAGSYAQDLDVVEARVVARTAGQGTSTNWTLIKAKPTNGQFTGTLTVRGGWYRVEVRGLRNGQVVASDAIERFGVGEVFAIVGHSNAQGSSCIIDGVDNCPTMDGAADDRVTVVPVDQSTPEFRQYENTADTRYLPGLTFNQLATFSGISPFAKVAWFWGRMGDVLVQRINVPVLIYNAGFGGTNMEHNYKAAYDIPFEHGFCRYDLRMPFVNLRNLMNLYVGSTGIRAVILNHGENDRGNPTDLIVTHHYGVIDKARQEFNKPNLAWIIALSSFVSGPFDNVRSAQLQVINRSNYQTYQGPDLDNISSREDRPDGIHYSPSGQRKAGELWANAITDDFLRTVQPYLAQQQPLTSVACATDNQLTLTQPAGYEYTWNTGSSDQSLTVGAGTYSARLRNPQKQVVFPPAVTVPTGVQPDFPTITANGPGTYCQPGKLILESSHTGQNLWNTGVTSATLAVAGTGTYSVQARGAAYGCLSEPSYFTVSAAGTDLSLALRASRRIVSRGDTVTFIITVRNEGACESGAVTIQNRLPPNLTFVSSADLTVADSIVTGNVTNIPVGQSVTRRYVARLTAAGAYQNAAQLTAQAGRDPDSQPNSGTGDGQDDAMMVHLRTLNTDSLRLFASPNPLQTTLPPVRGNQPVMDGTKADLSLTMHASRQYVRAGQKVTITLLVRNRGAQTATNVTLQNDLPTGLQFSSSASGMTVTGSVVSGTIAQLASGQEAKLSFVATVTSSGSLTNAAQISSVDQPDPDSKPGNGTTNGEDDTARLTLRTNGTSAARRAASDKPPATPAQPMAIGSADSVPHRFWRGSEK